MPWMAVEMISSDTPISPLVFSPGGEDGGGEPRFIGGPRAPASLRPSSQSQAHRSQPPPLLTQQPPKSDGGREGCEVDEDDGCQALGVQGVPEIAEILGVTPTDVPDQPPKESAGALKRVAFQVVFLLLHLQLQQGWGCKRESGEGKGLAEPHIPPRHDNKSPTCKRVVYV